MKALPAFTFIEVILSVTLLGLIALMPTLLDTSIINQLQAEVAFDQVGQSYKKAQVFAKNSRGDSTWGVYVQSQSITVFKGNSYATRDTQFDDVSTYDTKTSLAVIAGSGEIIFSKMTGVPSATAIVRITQNNTGRTSTVTLSSAGGLTYE